MRKICAADLMNEDVLSVSEEMVVHDLAEFLIENEISGAPVLAEGGKLIGVVSTFDIVAAASEEAAIDHDDRKPNFYLRDLQGSYSEDEIRDLHIENGGLTVGDIMTPSAYTVEEDASVSEVASMMLEAHLHRVLVTRDGELVGIISSSDLLGLLVEN